MDVSHKCLAISTVRKRFGVQFLTMTRMSHQTTIGNEVPNVQATPNGFIDEQSAVWCSVLTIADVSYKKIIGNRFPKVQTTPKV